MGFEPGFNFRQRFRTSVRRRDEAITGLFAELTGAFAVAALRLRSVPKCLCKTETALCELSDPLIARPFVRLGYYRQGIFSRYRLQRKHLWFGRGCLPERKSQTAYFLLQRPMVRLEGGVPTIRKLQTPRSHGAT